MGTVNSADMVNSPPHYLKGGLEAIDAIRAALGDEPFLGYCQGNCLKYLWRARHKGGLQDLHKARWYLDRLIELAESWEARNG